MAYSEMSYAEVSQDPEADLPSSPRRQHPRLPGASLGRYRLGRLGWTGLFFGTAIASGFLFYVIFSVFLATPVLPYKAPSLLPVNMTELLDAEENGQPVIGLLTSDTRLKPEAPDIDYHELSLEEMTEMIGRTRGYFARDWSLPLGWNNVRRIVCLILIRCSQDAKMRYIIEAAHTQAKILNRTLVLPSFVYARACEYELCVLATSPIRRVADRSRAPQ
jgi:hypothetical protein